MGFYATFGTCLLAYLVGWPIANLIFHRLTNWFFLRQNEEARDLMAAKIAREWALLMDRKTEAVSIVDAINELRSQECDNLVLHADSADFWDRPDCVVTCFGNWTGWGDRRFEGYSLLDCLNQAVQAKRTSEEAEQCDSKTRE